MRNAVETFSPKLSGETDHLGPAGLVIQVIYGKQTTLSQLPKEVGNADSITSEPFARHAIY